MSLSLDQAIRQLSSQAMNSQEQLAPATGQTHGATAYLLKSYQIKFRYQFHQEKTTAKSLNISLLNLSADLRYQRKQDQDSWLTIEVEQLPLTHRSTD